MKRSTTLLLSLAGSVAVLGLASCEHYAKPAAEEAAAPVANSGPANKGPESGSRKLEMQRAKFAAMDTDQDGFLSAAEHEADHNDKFKLFDGDGSGAFDVDEFLAVRMGPGPKEGGQGKKMQKMQMKKKQKFAKMDADGSGDVTLAELQAFSDAKFLMVDTDQDGSVSFAEFKAHKSAHAGKGKGKNKHGKMKAKFAKMDTDQDGVMSGSEHDAAHLVPFVTRDLNGDGTLSAVECEAAREGWSAEKIAKTIAKHEAMDSDHDGILTQDEFLVKARSGFASADTDADGSVSWDEFHAHHKAKMK